MVWWWPWQCWVNPSCSSSVVISDLTLPLWHQCLFISRILELIGDPQWKKNAWATGQSICIENSNNFSWCYWASSVISLPSFLIFLCLSCWIALVTLCWRVFQLLSPGYESNVAVFCRSVIFTKNSVKCAKTIKNEEVNILLHGLFTGCGAFLCQILAQRIISLVGPKLVPYRYHAPEMINAGWRHSCCSLQSNLRVSGVRALLWGDVSAVQS